MRLVTAAEMRRLEAAADAAGLSYAQMMEAAGGAVAGAVHDLIDAGTVVVLAGPGNNGGDGLAAAARLAGDGFDVRVLLWRRRVDGDPLIDAVRGDGSVPVVHTDRGDALPTLSAWLTEADVVIDALLGTGASRPVEGTLAEVLDALAAAADDPEGPLVVAVDLPTGLDADTGAIDPHTVPADVTVTFGFPKVGQFAFPGAATVGELIIDPLGIPDVLGDVQLADAPDRTTLGLVKDDRVTPGAPGLTISTAAEVAASLPTRPLDAHKGTFGKVLVIAGSANYTGAAFFAAAAAYRAGCGLVTLGVPDPVRTTIAGLLPEATYLPLADDHGVLCRDAAQTILEAWTDYDAVLLGPGLTATRPAAEFLEALLSAPVDIRPARWLVDADGLNLLARVDGGLTRIPRGTVLTPHPGEMARLLGGAGSNVASNGSRSVNADRGAAPVNADRVGVARRSAGAWGHVVVLKGAFTAVAAPDGRVTINPFATPALATAGTGDVLSGLIAGLLAQGMDPYAAAVAGAHVHGLAGEIAGEAIGARGTMAGDVLGRVTEAFGRVEGR